MSTVKNNDFIPIAQNLLKLSDADSDPKKDFTFNVGFLVSDPRVAGDLMDRAYVEIIESHASIPIRHIYMPKGILEAFLMAETRHNSRSEMRVSGCLYQLAYYGRQKCIDFQRPKQNESRMTTDADVSGKQMSVDSLMAVDPLMSTIEEDRMDD